jgi:hypothetical protein
MLDHHSFSKPLPDEDIGDIDSDDKPFNFNMEKYDSFMVDSEDGGLGLSYSSNKLKNATK